MISAERKRLLIVEVGNYIIQHYCGRRIAPAKELGFLPEESLAAPVVRDDDWDILKRICPPPKRSEERSPVEKQASALADGEVQFSLKSTAPDTTSKIHNLIERADGEETFTEMLLRLISERKLTEPEVYNSVFMDRKLFNKIRNTPDYQPSKRTALLLAVALKLDLQQTQEFIGKAGFRLVPWNKFDVIAEYFIANGNYDVFEINEMLAEFKMPLLLRCD